MTNPGALNTEELKKLELRDLIVLARHYGIHYDPNAQPEELKNTLVDRLTPRPNMDILWDVEPVAPPPPQYSARIKRIMERKENE